MGMAFVLVMGMGMRAMGGWLWARACAGHGASVGVVGVPWLWQGEGASGVPIQRNLLDVYPNLELTRYKRRSPIWSSKESKGVPYTTSNSLIASIDFIKRDFQKNNKKKKKRCKHDTRN